MKDIKIFETVSVAPLGVNTEAPPLEEPKRMINKADGRIYYDTMGTNLINSMNFAEFGQNPTDAAFPSGEWSSYASTSTDGTVVADTEAANGTFMKRFGEEILLLIGEAKFDLVSKTGVTHNSEITVTIRNSGGGLVNEDSYIVSSSSYTAFTLEIDISAITDGSMFIAEIHLDSKVTISSGQSDGSTYSTETFLRERFVLRTATGN